MTRFSISTAGRGVAEGSGRVIGVYGRAAYVQAPGRLFALTTPEVPLGPIHARTGDDLSPLRVGDRVDVDLTAARLWEGALPSALDVELLSDVLAAAPPSCLDPLPQGDLETLAAYLGGRGPGLTPAGDDCLAGMFLVALIRGEDVTGIASRVATNDIALAFLHWAARSQSIEPVHRLLTAADKSSATEALDDLLRFGHSSGADLAFGLRTAVQRRDDGVVQRRDDGVVQRRDDGVVQRRDDGVVQRRDDGVVQRRDDGVVQRRDDAVVQRLCNGVSAP